MVAASGLLGGYVTSYAFFRTEAGNRVCNILLLAYSGIGVYQMLHGDPEGIFLVLLLGGTVVGNLLHWGLSALEGQTANTGTAVNED